jgi:hypothetical protein
MLWLLLEHGSECLNREELDACVESHLSAYYRFLAKRRILGNDRKLWEYHRAKLAASKVGFSWTRLTVGALAEFLDALLNPKQTLERILGRDELNHASPVQAGAGQPRRGELKAKGTTQPGGALKLEGGAKSHVSQAADRLSSEERPVGL